MTTYKYTVLFEHFKDEDHEGYTATVPVLPGCVTWGETLEEAREMVKDAISGYIESLRKHGEPIPLEDGGAPEALVQQIDVSLAAP